MSNLFIVSPSYSGSFCSQFTESLADTVKDLHDHGHRCLYKTVAGVHWIDIARDIAAHVFLHTNCDYMLQIDDDLGWTPDAPRRMMAMEPQIMGGIYPLKTDLITEVRAPKNRLPGGFLMIRRDVVEAMSGKANKYSCSSLQYGKLHVAGLFTRVFTGDGYVGEDYAFCDRAVEQGFNIEVFEDVQFSHVGVKAWQTPKKSFVP